MPTPTKLSLFLDNARLMQQAFDITPLLYGSLGLEYLTGEDLNSDDIDILIYEKYLTDRWDEFRATLEKEGYVLADEHEHTFCKDGVCYSYASIEELYSFAGIPLTKIGVKTEEDVKFRLLTLEQYQTVYRASSKDGYRVNVRNKKDKEKLKFIYKQIVKEQKKKNPHPALNALAEGGIELLLLIVALAIGLLVMWILPEYVDMPIEIAILIGGFILAAIIGVFLLVDYFVRFKKKDKK